PQLDAVNPIGSGDSLLAGLVDGWIDQLEPEALIRHATGCAVANAMTWDAGAIEPAEAARWADPGGSEPLAQGWWRAIPSGPRHPRGPPMRSPPEFRAVWAAGDPDVASSASTGGMIADTDRASNDPEHTVGRCLLEQDSPEVVTSPRNDA